MDFFPFFFGCSAEFILSPKSRCLHCQFTDVLSNENINRISIGLKSICGREDCFWTVKFEVICNLKITFDKDVHI
jgi:hypothetical protein